MASDDGGSSSEQMNSRGALVKQARLRAGITREQLGRRLHEHGYRAPVDSDTVGRWERGERPIPKLATPHLEDILGIEIPR